MSYVGPDFDPPQPRRSRGRTLTVAVAALVPGALLGWVMYEAVGSPGGDGGGSGNAAVRPSSATPSDTAPTISATNDDKPPGPTPTAESTT
ncbi:N-acetylmuramoyl-L-alanine amidase, partial [Streptomyces muensis]|nr:N-acetylmuramoyl-L-alanine amidase [Streptomyces muensis]